MSNLIELSLTQEDRKPPPALSSSVCSPDPVVLREKQLSRSVQTESGKERSDENIYKRAPTDIQAQSMK